MGIDRDTVRQIERIFRPLATRIVNMVARGVVQIVYDDKKLQRMQVGGLAGQTVDGDGSGAEHFQQYGFSSNPQPGAECVVIFPNGDQSHPLVIASGDRSSRPTGGKAGEVCMYTDEGDVIRLGRGHVVSVETTGQVLLGSSGASQAAIKGTQRNSAEQTFLAALTTYATNIQAVADPGNTATPVLLAAIATFQSAVAAALSTKVKLE
ncbi:MAG TPA: phage baseplate assembly protein V [Kofleriaceae bacterium]